MSRRIVVLGLGNPLMGDDGAGLQALEVLRNNYRFGSAIDLEDGGTLGLGLLPVVEEADSLLILDAVHFDGQPGTLVVREGEDIPRCLDLKLSPHQTGFRETLALAALRGNLPRRLALIGVEVAHAKYASPLSQDVQDAVPVMVFATVAKLASWGCAVSPLAPEQPLDTQPNHLSLRRGRRNWPHREAKV